ncbi:MAG TPA: aminopeptidase [Gammaproteobacteria bacterium]|nr:aminopeptidase [Gammaproteobacteria bacterium]
MTLIKISPVWRWFGLLWLALQISACSTLSYYHQSLQGQMELLAARQPIDEALADPGIPEQVRTQLQLLKKARQYAVTELSLPDNGSYKSYADLHRPYVVWTVVATQALSLEPHTWCYPIFGCLAYRAYFSQADAEREAQQLQQAGYDVYVAGIVAYSTLGWFDDPFLNTMLGWDEARLVGTLFHELAHQQMYVPDDTEFNESFAMTVQREGVRRWMRQFRDEKALQAWRDAARRDEDFIGMVLKIQHTLQTLYETSQSDEIKRLKKRELLRQLRRDYRLFRQRWSGYEGYDHWMFQDLNNAMIASVSTYHKLIPAFEALLQKSNYDMDAFYAAVKSLSLLDKEQRHARLAAVLERQ